MIPAEFDYVKAQSLAHAIELLVEHGDDAKLLAGGHSLLPLMKLRLAAPAMLIDIGDLEELSAITEVGDEIQVGALARHRAVETSDLLRREAPLLAATAHEVGDPQVRNRGTIGGSLAHGDPASDLPAALIALNATMVAEGPSGRREISIDDFFLGFFETALAPDEVLVACRVPKVPDAHWGFEKFNRRAQDWAIVGVAAVHGDQHIGIGLVNMDSVPIRAVATEEALRSGASIDDAASRADEGCSPPADLHGSEDYRRHLARVLTRRALTP